MKKNKSLIMALFVALATVFINVGFTAETQALEDKWHVRCNYDSEGNFTGGSCESLGFDACHCPSSIFGEN